MKKIILITQRVAVMDEVFMAFIALKTEITSKSYYDFRPYKCHIQDFRIKGEQLGVEDIKLDMLDKLCDQTESAVLAELYKLINDQNRERIFNYIFERLNIKIADQIFIDYTLKDKHDSGGVWQYDIEGVLFYNFLKKIKKIPEKKITILCDSISKECLNITARRKGVEFSSENFYEYEYYSHLKNIFKPLLNQ